MQITSEANVVHEKTLALCQALLDDPGFQGIRQRIDTFMGNDTAKTQFQSVTELGEHLQHKQQQGLSLTELEISNFEKQRQELINNEVARSFLEAQQDVQKVQESIMQYVSKTFELGRLPNQEDLSCGCGSGCGCH